MHRPSALVAVVPGILAVLLVGACGLQKKSMTVGATVNDIAQVSGWADPNNSCAPPTTAAPDPVAWYAAQSPTNKRWGSVGFQVWRNLANNGACQEHKEIAYRTMIEFDLTTVAALKTFTSARLTLASKVLPADVTADASNLCDSHSGGLGSLWDVAPPVPVLTGMTVLPLAPPNPNGPVTPGAGFPVGRKLVGFTLPWIAGTISPVATTLASGQGGATFTVDVTGSVQNALNANQSTVQFMLSSTDEAFPRPITPPASIDCLTLIEVQPMNIAYVGS